MEEDSDGPGARRHEGGTPQRHFRVRLKFPGSSAQAQQIHGPQLQQQTVSPKTDKIQSKACSKRCRSENLSREKEEEVQNLCFSV